MGDMKRLAVDLLSLVLILSLLPVPPASATELPAPPISNRWVGNPYTSEAIFKVGSALRYGIYRPSQIARARDQVHLIRTSSQVLSITWFTLMDAIGWLATRPLGLSIGVGSLSQFTVFPENH